MVSSILSHKASCKAVQWRFCQYTLAILSLTQQCHWWQRIYKKKQIIWGHFGFGLVCAAAERNWSWSIERYSLYCSHNHDLDGRVEVYIAMHSSHPDLLLRLRRAHMRLKVLVDGSWYRLQRLGEYVVQEPHENSCVVHGQLAQVEVSQSPQQHLQEFCVMMHHDSSQASGHNCLYFLTHDHLSGQILYTYHILEKQTGKTENTVWEIHVQSLVPLPSHECRIEVKAWKKRKTCLGHAFWKSNISRGHKTQQIAYCPGDLLRWFDMTAHLWICFAEQYRTEWVLDHTIVCARHSRILQNSKNRSKYRIHFILLWDSVAPLCTIYKRDRKYRKRSKRE